MRKILSVLLILLCFLNLCLPVQARELSKAAKIFKEVKDGVVTIFTSVGHGSRFFIVEI